MKLRLLSALAFVLAASVASAAEPPRQVAGVDLEYIDAAVRPQDDFYQYFNGKWLASAKIPADRSSWGSFFALYEETQSQLRAIIEAAAADTHAPPGSDAQKIGDFYASFMDESTLDRLGLKPLDEELARIAALNDKRQIPALIAHLNRLSVNTAYRLTIHQDARDSTRYIVDLGQSGLGMPDRDYYLKRGDPKLGAARAKYQTYIGDMLALADDAQAAADARRVLALETALAKVQWTKVQNRDPVKTYNKVELTALGRLAPGYPWKAYLDAAGVSGKADYVIISQPSYFTGFNRVLKDMPLSTWKAYFRFHLLSSYAPFLSKPFVDANFAFNGTALRGIPQNLPRWKRAVATLNGSIGEIVGKLYVARYFPAENKLRMEALVQNLLAAYRQSIVGLDWMGARTRQQALQKLAKLTPKIGYPNKWRDYSALQIVKGDLAGNVMRARQFEYQYQIAKLGKPIDREEWEMTPQTVNAYYNPELNEIVFPAAILQPPFFDPNAEDAANYGAIGAVIGHEISHGFDDQGSQYDGDGNLRDWWTKQDHKNFAAKTRMLVEQYDAFSPVPGYHVNGKLTLGENIADNSGLAIAYKAYHLSLGGKAPPVIDGLSGDQRLYMAFARIWRSKTRERQALVWLKSDPHAPDRFRVDGVLPNQPGFYSAFGVKRGDRMYLPPQRRVIIW
ncbi:MAG: M13 family metallopeptidase [Burkholderiales bacterium]